MSIDSHLTTSPPIHPQPTHDGASLAERRPRTTLAVLAGLLALLWTVVEALPVFLAGRYSLYQIVWWRYATHLLALAIILGPRAMFALLHTPRPGVQVGRGLLMLAMPAAFITAVGRSSVTSVLAVFWLCPLLILAFAAIVLRERARWVVWLGGAAAVLGAEMILSPERAAVAAGGAVAVGLALVMGLTFALYVVLTRSLRTEPRNANLIFTAACVFVPLTFVMPTLWLAPTLQDFLVMTTIGLLGLALLWVLDRMCELAPASSLALLMPLQLVCSAALAIAVGETPLGRMVLIGCALVTGVAVWGIAIGAGVRGGHKQTGPAPIQIP